MIDTIKNGIGEVVKGLQTSPMLLAIMVLNLIMVGGLIYIMAEVSSANTARFNTILERCLPK
jgi:hypothetical protein